MNFYKKVLSMVLAMLMTVGTVFAGNVTEVKAADSVTVSYDVTHGSASEKKNVFEMMNKNRTIVSRSALIYDAALEATADKRAEELVIYYSTSNKPDGTAVDSTNEIIEMESYSKLVADIRLGKESYNSVGIGHAECAGKSYWVAEFSDSTGSGSEPVAGPSNTVTQTVLEEYVQSKNLVLSKSSTQIDVNASEALPTGTLSICTKDGFHTLEASAVPLSSAMQSQAVYSWKEPSDGIVKIDDAKNTVTGLKKGETTADVTVKLNGTDFATGQYKISVRDADVAVSSVKLNKTALSLAVNGTETLTATVEPNNASNKKVTWSSSDESVATVNENGLVKAIKQGTAKITATSEDGAKTATCNLTVKDASKIVTSVSLDKTSLNLTIGTSEKLTATILPATADNKNITWTSSNKDIALVSGASTIAIVTGLKAGSATITATTDDGEKKATCNVTVGTAVNVQSVALSKTTADLYIGETVTLTTTITPADATDKSVTWKSNNESVATVDGNGLVTAKAEGSAVITVTTKNGAKTATCTVNVKIKPAAQEPAPATTTAAPVQEPAVTPEVSTASAETVDLAAAGIINVKNKYVYSGSEIKPIPTVIYHGSVLTHGIDYNITYINNSTVGTASIYLTGIGNYAGNITRTFKIVPASTSLKQLKTDGAGKLKVKWKSQAQGVKGYEIQYSLKKGMPSGQTKTKTVSGKSQSSVTLKKLKSGKEYYVRIRVYGSVSGTKYFSSWSKIKSKKVK